MSLNTAIRKKNGKKVKLEELAKKFSELLDEKGKKEALSYYNSLDKEAQRYISGDNRYSWKLRAAQMQF